MIDSVPNAAADGQTFALAATPLIIAYLAHDWRLRYRVPLGLLGVALMTFVVWAYVTGWHL